MMAGKVWFWSRKRHEASAFSPQAWRDGVPEASDAVIVIDDNALPPAWQAAGEPFVLNAEASAFTRLSSEDRKRRLARAGVVMAAGSEAGSSRTFAVSLFHLHPIEVKRAAAAAARQQTGRDGSTKGWTIDGPGNNRILEPANLLYNRLTRLALKALHAARLELGIVNINVEDSGRCTVRSIQLPEIDISYGDAWRDAIQRFTAEWQSRSLSCVDEEKQKLLIGADPEFLLLSKQGKVVSAARYLEGGHGTGCDAAVVGGRVMYPVAELRPAPAADPEQLAGHIRKLLIQANTRITDHSLQWAAGGMPVAGFALGGHIHISGSRLTSRLLHQLDSYVALPLAMIETAGDHARRPRYGTLGDFRLQPHGGFEYRTLPSWLVSPLAAKGAFALMLLCARETDHLHYLPSRDDPIIEAYYSGDRLRLRSCLEPLIASIQATKSYGELCKWIDPVMAAARQGKSWDTQTDIRLKWRIPTPQ